MERLTPRPAQLERIDRFLAEPTKAGALADEMGVGKSLVAVEIVLRFERTLTVGVKDTAAQFQELIQAQSDGAVHLRVIDSTKAGKIALADMLVGKPGHYFAGSQYLTRQDYEHRTKHDYAGRIVWKTDKNGDTIVKESTVIGPCLVPVPETEAVQLKTFAKMKPLDVLVFDEVHVIQNRKSAGFRTIKTLPTERRLGMSGTLFGNKFVGMWSICRWLWPDLIDRSFIRWQAEWCATETVYIKGGASTERVTGERSPGEFVKTLPLYIRSEAEPMPAPLEVYVDLTPNQRQQYSDLEADLVTWINDNPLVADLPPVLRQRLRTAALAEMSVTADGDVYFAPDCKSSKLQALGGILNNYWSTDEAVIIGTASKKFADIVFRRMSVAGEKVALWTGDTSSRKRAQIKADFLDGRTTRIVATIASMSTGLDGFQRVCAHLVWLDELDGNEAINAQFARRLFRPGRVGNFEAIKLIARNTLDEKILGANLARAIGNRSTLRKVA